MTFWSLRSQGPAYKSFKSFSSCSALVPVAPVLLMERYTPESPEPKRSWDQRPSLPRRRPVEISSSPAVETRQPLPRLRLRAPLPRLKHVKASSLLRLKKLQARLRKAKDQKEPLPRLRGGHRLSRRMVEALPDVPTGSHLVELTIQGRPVQFWDISDFPVPADQPMDSDDETPGDVNQGLHGIYPTKVLGRVTGDDTRSKKRSIPRALRQVPMKKRDGKKSAGTAPAAAASSGAKDRSSSTRKLPKKAKGSIRESLKAPGALASTGSASSRPHAPKLRAAKSKAAASSGARGKDVAPSSSTAEEHGDNPDPETQRRIMNERCAALLEAQRAAFRRRVEQRREAIKAATAKARAAPDLSATEPTLEATSEDVGAAISADAGTHDVPMVDVQPDANEISGQSSLPSAYMKGVILAGLSAVSALIICRYCCSELAQVMAPFFWTSSCTSWASILIYLCCSSMWLSWMMPTCYLWQCVLVFGYLRDLHCMLIEYFNRAWQYASSCVLLLRNHDRDRTTFGTLFFTSSDYTSQRTTPLSFCEPSGPKSRADPLSGPIRCLCALPMSGWLCFLIFFMVFSRVGGARVASDATEAGSQGLLASATSGGRHLSTAKKRAFHRAQRRAQVAGGTFYKGRWCTARSLNVGRVAISANDRTPRPGTLRTWQHNPKVLDLNIISWNSSGLGAAVLPEFLLWLDQLPQESRPNIVLIQESHWRFTSEYRHGNWLAYHNGVSEGSTDRCAGLLTLIRVPGVSAEQIRVHNVLQGRLTHIRIDFPSRNVDVLHVYQHAVSNDPSRAIKEKRRRLFNRLDALVQSMPSRNLLVVGGDFNQPLPQVAPHTGHAICVPSPTNPDHSREGNTLLHIAERHNLVALNTFHCRPSFTFQHCASRTQIDFIFVRSGDAFGRAKRSRPLYDSSLMAWRDTKHHPIIAELSLPRHWWPAQTRSIRYDRAARIVLL